MMLVQRKAPGKWVTITLAMDRYDERELFFANPLEMMNWGLGHQIVKSTTLIERERKGRKQGF